MFQPRAGRHARQLALVPQVFQFGEQAHGGIHVAAQEGDARAHAVAGDHVVGQAHIACQRQVDLQQVIGAVDVIALVEHPAYRTPAQALPLVGL